MNHQDHMNLLREGVTPGAWADLGAGTGAFTLALAELLGADGTIVAVDQRQEALQANAQAMATQFPAASVHYHPANFTAPMPFLSLLEGIVMANALHFIPFEQQGDVLRHLAGYLQPAGRFVIVEYSLERGNYAVPYPIPFRRWQALSAAAGFNETRLLMRRPSRTMGEIYSALSVRALA